MSIKSIIGVTCACLLLITFKQSVASVVYTYTGNLFDTVDNSGAFYDTTMSVTGTVQLASELGTNLNGQSVSPLSFSFKDGVNTATHANAATQTFIFWTDGAGLITAWDILLKTDDTVWQTGEPNSEYAGIATRSGAMFVNDTDQGIIAMRDSSGFNTNYFGAVSDAAGTWEVSAVPIPPAVWLFGSGLIGLIGVARRKKA